MNKVALDGCVTLGKSLGLSKDYSFLGKTGELC